MRSIWNGAISFGLVSIPIKLVNATENHAVSFRQIHTADGGRIRYRKVCELDEEELTSADIGKGYEDADGSIIPITDEDLAALPLPTAKTIEIVAFVPLDSIDPLQMDAAYYLVANGVPAAKPYILLREALKRSRRVALAKFALRGRERLGMLRVVGDAIAMHGLLWPDEIRSHEGAAPEASVTVRDAELDLADTLMDTLGDVEMESLHDDYREAVEELIASKTSGGEASAQPTAEAGVGKVLDLMSALEKSVRAAKSSRGEEGDSGADGEGRGDAQVTELRSAGSSGSTGSAGRKKAGGKKAAGRKAAAKKPAAKKASSGRATGGGGAAKKTAAKKTTAKKSAAKRTPAKKRASA
ncbi:MULTISPECIES: Ku protein [unclassified Streptomyces]|uniref:non-homologous end joining protein Ku n=1 Tax=unclassified Streptomyces TaxID=2593676 RepID=UPI002254A98F|nr:Ku protein [Streptomyces sp. NBC_01500]MCX4548190.1 Ku protein [Streptomyces sp. NBC_01500]WSV53872.1 Ku protein [Streptomyces sp. NBC_01014]